jgi:hypothetical protein
MELPVSACHSDFGLRIICPLEIKKDSRMCLPLGGQAGSRLGWREHQGLDETSLERAKRYRAHAAEIRSAAADIKHPENRAALFRLAVTYERLAERLEVESETPSAIEKDG